METYDLCKYLHRSAVILVLTLFVPAQPTVVGFPSAQAQDFAGLAKKAQPRVRMIYLVPSDRLYRRDHESAIKDAIHHVQIWYQDQMGNSKTFSLLERVVEVIYTEHTSDWYSTSPAGPDQSLWFWFNAIGDGLTLTGGRFEDPDNRWVFYIDADPACGQVTGAAAGVVLLPANDLRGLIGETNIPPCPSDPPDTGGLCRWVGGLGHELGHAFSLPHPIPCPGANTDNALMCLGYIIYPNTFLLPEDKATLNLSTFFAPTHRLNPNRMKRLGCEIQ